MTPQEIARSIDHTLLKPEATSEDVRRLCREAAEHSFFAVCVNSRFVPLAAGELKGTNVAVAAVVGFPLGAMSTAAKAFEAAQAVKDGATEIDMVLPIGALKEGRDDEVREDIAAVVNATKPALVKVILETSMLDDARKILACRLSVEAGAAFVKTSTGFGGGGATVEDVKLMKETVGDKAKVKASGGVRSLEQARAMLDAGASRLGTSSGVALVRGLAIQGGY